MLILDSHKITIFIEIIQVMLDQTPVKSVCIVLICVAGGAQLGEHQIVGLGVAGSDPVARPIFLIPDNQYKPFTSYRLLLELNNVSLRQYQFKNQNNETCSINKLATQQAFICFMHSRFLKS